MLQMAAYMMWCEYIEWRGDSLAITKVYEIGGELLTAAVTACASAATARPFSPCRSRESSLSPTRSVKEEKERIVAEAACRCDMSAYRGGGRKVGK